MTHLVLALLLAVDGGTPAPDWHNSLYDSCPEAPPPEQLDGGAWLLPPARAARVDCLMATCDVRRQELEAPQAPAGVVVIALVVGLAVGAAGGAALVWRLKR